MKLLAYLYVNRGIEYDLPFEPIIKSLLMFCDRVLVGTDPRFNDGTAETLHGLKTDKLEIKEIEFDYNVENPHGTIKQTLREFVLNECVNEHETYWLLDIDADEFIKPKDGLKLRVKLESLNVTSRLKLVALKYRHFFNGNYLKLSEPDLRPCLTRPDSGLIHGGRERMGAGYVSEHSGRLFPPNLILDVTVWHYGWYSLPRKWEMKQALHYYKGRLEKIYSGLDSYKRDLDGDPVDFWDVAWNLPLQEYISGIKEEMKDKSIKRYLGKHHPLMREWIKRQRVYDCLRWKITKLF